MSSRWTDVFVKHQDLLLKNDVRAYPSRKFKQGFNAEKLRPWLPLLADLFDYARTRMLQSEGKLLWTVWMFISEAH